jgi:hypothetical protein
MRRRGFFVRRFLRLLLGSLRGGDAIFLQIRELVGVIHEHGAGNENGPFDGEVYKIH